MAGALSAKGAMPWNPTLYRRRFTLDWFTLVHTRWHVSTISHTPRHDEVTGITYSQTVAIFASGDLIVLTCIIALEAGYPSSKFSTQYTTRFTACSFVWKWSGGR